MSYSINLNKNINPDCCGFTMEFRCQTHQSRNIPTFELMLKNFLFKILVFTVRINEKWKSQVKTWKLLHQINYYTYFFKRIKNNIPTFEMKHIHYNIFHKKSISWNIVPPCTIFNKIMNQNKAKFLNIPIFNKICHDDPE